MASVAVALAGIGLGVSQDPTKRGSAAWAESGCTAKALLENPQLGQFYGYVKDVTSGKVLLNVRGAEQTPSASVMKVFTAAAALVYLPPSFRAETHVYKDKADPSTIYLVGGGDHTISAFVPPSYTTYKSPARLASLASQVKGKIGTAQINKIVVDESYFDENDFNKFWQSTDRTYGYVSAISALMADADRANGDLTSKSYSAWRSSDPAWRAGSLFKKALGAQAATASIVHGLAPDEKVSLAVARSQPIAVWIEHALHVSDNTETEIIARHVELALQMPTTFASVQPMVEQTLDLLGISHEGLLMRDASGLSHQDRVTPKMVVELLANSASPNSAITDLASYMATPTTYGTLANRFNGSSASARDELWAKSGYIPGLSSLAGLLNTKDGHQVAFAFFARSVGTKRIGSGTKPAIDALVARAWACGAHLTK